MKFFIAIFFSTIVASGLIAQTSTKKLVGVTITNTANDTLEFKNVPGKLTGIQATLDRATGSVTGKIYLDGAIISGNYILIDSLTVTDKPQNTKVFTIARSTGTTYLSYRVRFNCTGTQTSVGSAAYLRREDE